MKLFKNKDGCTLSKKELTETRFKNLINNSFTLTDLLYELMNYLEEKHPEDKLIIELLKRKFKENLIR